MSCALFTDSHTVIRSSLRNYVNMYICQQLEVLDVLDTAARLRIDDVRPLLNSAIGSACRDHVSRESPLHRSRWATALSVPPGTREPRVQFKSAQGTSSSSTSGEDEARVDSASAHQSSHSHSPGQVKIRSPCGSGSTSCTFQPSKTWSCSRSQ
jgi:hypothetical protein